MKIKLKSNLTELTTSSNDKIFISYETAVAACIEGVYYKTAKKWSRTTSRHLSFWLEDVEAAEREQIFFDDLLTVNA